LNLQLRYIQAPYRFDSFTLSFRVMPMIGRIAIVALVVVLAGAAGLLYLAESSTVPTRLVEKQVPDDAMPR
jgi:hypothetical protein